MSTSITINDWQIVIYQQKEMYSKLEYWIVEVWQNFDQLAPRPGEAQGKAERLYSWDNLNYSDTGYSLSNDTLETLIEKAISLIKGEKE